MMNKEEMAKATPQQMCALLEAEGLIGVPGRPMPFEATEHTGYRAPARALHMHAAMKLSGMAGGASGLSPGDLRVLGVAGGAGVKVQ